MLAAKMVAGVMAWSMASQAPVPSISDCSSRRKKRIEEVIIAFLSLASACCTSIDERWLCQLRSTAGCMPIARMTSAWRRMFSVNT